MARRLPWAVDKAPPAKRQRVAQTPRPKPERASSLDMEEPTVGEEDALLPGRQPQITPKRGTGPKSPSSSPLRPPPLSFESMREGYDGDDIYIMVEDEFQTIAQTYTAHLHHAEYKRLVKQAREAAPKALPEPTSPMSKEAKNRLQKLALQKRQKETLQQVMGPTSTEAEEEEVEEEEDKVIDLWSGTRLAPLMASGGLQKTSLIGLERMSSKTKAGMGFTRIQSGGHSIKDEADEDEGDQTRNGSESKTGHAQSTSHVLSSETSGSARSLAIHRRTGESSKEHPSASSSGQDGEPVLSENGRDEFRPRRLRPTTRPNQNGFLKRKSVEQDKQSRLEEVPMFII